MEQKIQQWLLLGILSVLLVMIFSGCSSKPSLQLTEVKEWVEIEDEYMAPCPRLEILSAPFLSTMAANLAQNAAAYGECRRAYEALIDQVRIRQEAED